MHDQTPSRLSSASMEYKVQSQQAIKPRLIIHGGAGNIQPDKFTPERYAEYRKALLTIVRVPSP